MLMCTAIMIPDQSDMTIKMRILHSYLVLWLPNSSERLQAPLTLMHISDHKITKQLWCAALQTVLIKHVRPRLLLTHNEGLCVHQPVQMMNATLFSALAFWRRNKVSLCASSAQQHQQTDTGERPSLLTHSSHYTPIPADTPPPPLALYMCSALTCICTREPHAATSSYSPVRDCSNQILIYM